MVLLEMSVRIEHFPIRGLIDSSPLYLVSLRPYSFVRHVELILSQKSKRTLN